MFKNIQIRLTAFTLISLICFLTAFSVVSIIQTTRQVSIGAQRGLSNLFDKVDSLDLKELDFKNNPINYEKNNENGANILRRPNLIFSNNINIIIKDVNNDIVLQSDNDFTITRELDPFFDTLVSNSQRHFEEISINDNNYWVLTDYKIIDQELYIVHLLSNRHLENEMFFIYIRGLVMIWIFSIIVLGLISWFLAYIALKPARTSWEQQKRLIADVSHELKTPLTVVKANLDIPISEPTDQIKDHLIWLNNAYEETNNMTSLVNELLTFSRIDAGQEKMSFSQVDLHELLIATSNKMSPLFSQKSIDFSTSISDELLIQGDYHRLNQLIKILLDNAFKYTEKGHVNITAYKKHQHIFIELSDTGCGISDEALPFIFDRFYKEDSSRSKSGFSSGLGLSIAKWIVHSHKGQITVNSELGNGSTFIVKLPAS